MTFLKVKVTLSYKCKCIKKKKKLSVGGEEKSSLLENAN